MGHTANIYNLVADIGGTNTRVALADGHTLVDGTVRRYENAAFPGLEAVLQQYLSDEGGVDTKAACVAVAGPVSDGRGTLTNLDWTIDETTLARATQAETAKIVNDLQAQGHGLDKISNAHLRCIIDGPKGDIAATKLVIGVGTGFNAAAVFEGRNERLVPPSESGHINLPVKTAQDLALHDFIAQDHGFAAVEEALSGRGIENIHAFVQQQDGGQNVRRKARDIMEACAAGNDAQALAAGRIFSTLLARVCSNLALHYLPFGGIYLVGGVSRAFGPMLQEFGFADDFLDKGRFSTFLKNFAVHIIEDDYAALTGSAVYLESLDS